MASKPGEIWWKDAVVYQIYPASFKDSNGDGLGDIPGIISKVDYLKELGVDVIWVSPMYESPQIDMGYDISNYEKVHEPYGTVKDMEVLIDECHKRGMKVILDLVVNHTSDQHEWFKESRSSKDNPKRDWYIWRPAKYAPDGTRMPPTNWRSHFSGSTWEWDEYTQEYYLHLYAVEQPDLNWESPACRQAIYDSSMRFWLDKGVDGFRIDCINMYSKGTDFPDAPIYNPKAVEQPAWMIYCNGPNIHKFLREMNHEVLDHYDVMTVGELPHTPDEKRVLQYVSLSDKQVNMVIQFDIVDIGQGLSYKYQYQDWKLPMLKEIVNKWQTFVEGTDAWTTAFCENHDQGRSVSRFGCDSPEYRVVSAKLLSMMMCAMTGTLFIYQGQEIGMINMTEDWKVEDLQDIEALSFYRSVAKSTNNDPDALAYVMHSIRILGRDNARIPMQWDSSPFGGFTANKKGAWMRHHELYPEINVAKQEKESGSVLNFWRTMIKVRKEHLDVFVHGAFRLFDLNNEQTFTFGKVYGDRKAFVALNFTSEPQQVNLPYEDLSLKIGNYDDAQTAESELVGAERTLRPWEGRIYFSHVTTSQSNGGTNGVMSNGVKR